MSELNDTSGASFAEANENFIGQDLIDGTLAHEVEGEKFLTFRLKNTIYGVEIKRIKEIIEYGGITRIPMTPPCIRGVLNLRGNVVPIVDLAERLECSGGDVSRRSCVIIVEVEDEDEKMDLGFVVDGVDQVVGIDEDHIEAAPAFGTTVKSEFISGMGNVNDGFITLLDMDTIFSVKSLSDLVEAIME